MNQSGFKQRDSCINQLLPITHDIYQSLNQGYAVRDGFYIFQRHLSRFGIKVLFIN